METNKSYWLSAIKVFKVACAHFYSRVSHKAFGRVLMLIWRAQGMQKLRRTCCGVVKVRKGWQLGLHFTLGDQWNEQYHTHAARTTSLSQLSSRCFGVQKTIARAYSSTLASLLISSLLGVIKKKNPLPLRWKEFCIPVILKSINYKWISKYWYPDKFSWNLRMNMFVY